MLSKRNFNINYTNKIRQNILKKNIEIFSEMLRFNFLKYNKKKKII